MSPHDLTRRTSLRLAATGTAGLAVAGLASLAPATADGGASPAGRPAPQPGAGLRPGGIAHVAVTATTLWVDPRTDRPNEPAHLSARPRARVVASAPTRTGQGEPARPNRPTRSGFGSPASRAMWAGPTSR